MADEKKTKGKSESQPAAEEGEAPEYTQEQLAAAVENARAEVRQEFETAVTELNERIKELESQPKPTKSGGVDVQAAIKQAVEQAKQQWDIQKNKELKELQRTVNELSKENTSRKVQVWKQNAIAAWNNQVIPELIKGNTEEEIDNSAAASHESWLEAMKTAGVQFEEEDEESETEEEETEEEEVPVTAEHAENFRTSAGLTRPVTIKSKSQPVSTQKSQGRVVAPPPVIPLAGDNGGSRRSNPEAVLRGVKGMTMREYREKRQQILANAKAFAGS